MTETKQTYNGKGADPNDRTLLEDREMTVETTEGGWIEFTIQYYNRSYAIELNNREKLRLLKQIVDSLVIE